MLLRDKERWIMNRVGQRERDTQNPKQAPGSELAVSTEPDTGLEPTNHEIMS